jgi:hypothetical protein
MRYTRIDLEGETGLFASITRKRESAFIEVEIVSPTGTKRDRVTVGDTKGQWAMAQDLRTALDGGPVGDIRDYVTAIQHLAK